MPESLFLLITALSAKIPSILKITFVFHSVLLIHNLLINLILLLTDIDVLSLDHLSTFSMSLVDF